MTSRQMTSEQHAKLAQPFANPDPGLSPEEAQRWQRFVRYYTALSKAALRRELLKANPNRQSPARDASDGQLALLASSSWDFGFRPKPPAGKEAGFRETRRQTLETSSEPGAELGTRRAARPTRENPDRSWPRCLPRRGSAALRAWPLLPADTTPPQAGGCFRTLRRVQPW